MFGACTQRARNRAIGRRLAPAELAHMGIDLRDEGRLAAERDRCLEKLDPLAFEIADRGVGDCRDSSRLLRARPTWQVAHDAPSGFGRGPAGPGEPRNRTT